MRHPDRQQTATDPMFHRFFEFDRRSALARLIDRVNQCSHLIDEVIGPTGIVEDEIGLAQPFNSSRLVAHPATNVGLIHASPTEPFDTNAIWYVNNDAEPPAFDEVAQNRDLDYNDLSL